MNRTIARCLYGVLFAGGLTLLGATAAHADTSGEDGVLSGTLVDAVVSVPVNVGGNAVSVLGDSSSEAASTPTAPAATAPAPAASTSGNDSVAGGTQIAPVISIPVTVGGNAVSVVGDATSTDATTPAAASTQLAGTPATTSGDESVAGGSQVAPVVNLPVTVGGNAVSVLGDSATSGSSAGSTPDAATRAGSASTTSGDHSVLGGTQVAPVLSAPIAVSGNAVSEIGDSETSGSSTGSSAVAATPPASSTTTSGDDSVLGGTQVVPVVPVPVTVGGNAVSVIGDSETLNSSAGSTTGAATPAPSTATTSGDDSVLGGTQVVPVVTAPITVGGNAVSVIGDSETSGAATGSDSVPAGSSAPATSGDGSLLGGTQVVPGVTAPITVGGNAVSVIGDSATGASGSLAPVAPATPAVPTSPTVPMDPATPVTPAVPVTPATPVAPTLPADTDVSSSGEDVTTGILAVTAATRVKASAAQQLADTGTSNASFLLTFAALMVLAGAAVTLLGRKRTTQAL